MTKLPGAFDSDMATQTLLQFNSYSLGFPTPALVPVEGSAYGFLWFSAFDLFLSNLRVSHLPCALLSHGFKKSCCSFTLLLTCWHISLVWDSGQPYSCFIMPGSSRFSDLRIRWAERSNCSRYSDKTFACQRVGNKPHEKSRTCNLSEISRGPVCDMLRTRFHTFTE